MEGRRTGVNDNGYHNYHLILTLISYNNNSNSGIIISPIITNITITVIDTTTITINCTIITVIFYIFNLPVH